ESVLFGRSGQQGALPAPALYALTKSYAIERSVALSGLFVLPVCRRRAPSQVAFWSMSCSQVPLGSVAMTHVRSLMRKPSHRLSSHGFPRKLVGMPAP